MSTLSLSAGIWKRFAKTQCWFEKHRTNCSVENIQPTDARREARKHAGDLCGLQRNDHPLDQDGAIDESERICSSEKKPGFHQF